MLDPELIPVFNTTDETIPPGGLVRTFDVNTSTGHSLGRKPDTDNDPAVCVNGPLSIPPKAVGTCSFYTRGVVAYDPADGVPAIGDSWGAKAGTWLLRKGYTGFAPLDPGIDGLVNAMRVTTAGPAGREPSWFLLSENTPPDSGHVRFIDATGTWSTGSTAFTNVLYPVEVDGVVMTPKPTATGVMWSSVGDPTKYEFLPVQYADVVSGTYYAGLMSTGTQTVKGAKTWADAATFLDDVSVGLELTVGSNIYAGGFIEAGTSPTTAVLSPLGATGAPPGSGSAFYFTSSMGLAARVALTGYTALNTVGTLALMTQIFASDPTGAMAKGYAVAHNSVILNSLRLAAAGFSVFLGTGSISSLGVMVDGVTGTLGPGAKSAEGIIYDAGSGSFFTAGDVPGALDALGGMTGSI